MTATKVNEPQFRNVCFTLNNWTQKEYDDVIALKYTYLVVGKEVGEQGTPHLQGYIEFSGGKRLSTLKKMLPRAHFEKRKGTAKQAADYCKYDDYPLCTIENDFEEFGKISEQGTRADLDEAKEAIMKGETTVKKIRQENPFFFHQYGRTLNTLEDDLQETLYRTERTQGIWLHGLTESGKTHAWKIHFYKNPHLYYIWKKTDKGWQDGYNHQPFVIIDEFRGAKSNISYDELLAMIDDAPTYDVSRRGRPPLNFTSKVVIITSSLSPEEAYPRRHEKDSIAQLNRRLKVFKMPDQKLDATEVLGVILDPSTVAKLN